MNLLKKVIITFIILISVGFIFIFCANYTIEKSTQAFVSYDLSVLPKEKVGLLLGTGKFLSNGQKNIYFYYRINAAEQLFKSGKIKNILISGDNSTKSYNEPEDMKNELISRGIPGQNIYLDFAGFRTLDSVIRAKEIFGLKSFIVISQEFHNERAIFIAQKIGLVAYGYNAQDVNKYYGFKTNIREYFARTKVFVDFILGIEPKFGGEKMEIR